MVSLPALRASALLLCAWSFVTGCTVTTNGSNNATASQCRIDGAVVCASNSVGYSCQGDIEPSLACGPGTTENDGETAYCCQAETASSCVSDSAAGCTNGSSGYSCAGGAVPTTTDPSLACSAPVEGSNGDALYCCIGVTSSTCAADPSVTGCTGGSYGFSCTSTDTPTQGNAALYCSTPIAAGNGSTLYCCIGFSGSTSSCAPDATVAGCTESYGFSCTSTDTPDQTNRSLSCSTATAGPNGELLYCCSHN